MEENRKVWHTEVISPQVDGTSRRLAEVEALRNFYLAGGTALALHIGHRKSVDLDFFSAQPFDEDAFLANMQRLPGLSVLARSSQTLYLHVSGTKVSFIGYSYPLLFPLEYFRGLAVADVRDIACMKLSALASRGSRRDFVDLYAVAQRHGLSTLVELFQQKFSRVNYSTIHVLKSLIYFADAEKEPIPDMLLPLSWEEVKAFFLHEVRKLGTS
jgi:predicted nucleotidyltransferase component of viral defense system